MTRNPSLSGVRRQRERTETAELLAVYGTLLTPRQLKCLSGYVTGKTFSQMAREVGVTRQAVHETVRSVQRLLKWYEEKLKLKNLGRGPGGTRPKAVTAGDTAEARKQLRALAEFVADQEVIYSPEWVASEIDGVLGLLNASRQSQ